MQKDLHLMYELGFAFGPLVGKAPVTTHGFKDFTRDREALSRWARRYQQCNWGGTCGPFDGRHGLITFDQDLRNGGTLDGLNLDLDKTLVVETGSGGHHVYYQWPYGPVRGKLADAKGIDLKFWRTGYTVMPGSIHPETGRPYRLISDTAPALVPDHLRKRVEQVNRVPLKIDRTSRTQRPEKKNAGLVRRVAEAQGGGRNQLTYWAFCRALERGADPGLIEDIRNAALSTDLPEREVETCLRSARNTIRSIA